MMVSPAFMRSMKCSLKSLPKRNYSFFDRLQSLDNLTRLLTKSLGLSTPPSRLVPVDFKININDESELLTNSQSFQDLLYSEKPINNNAFAYVRETIEHSKQPAYRGASAAHKLPSFSGTALVKFTAGLKYGIHVPSLLTALAENSPAYFRDLGRYFEVHSSKELRTTALLLRKVLSDENEMIVAKPILKTNINSITPIETTDRGINLVGPEIKNDNYAPFNMSASLKDLYLLAKQKKLIPSDL